MTMKVLRVLAPYLWRLDDDPQPKQDEEKGNDAAAVEPDNSATGEPDPGDICEM